MKTKYFISLLFISILKLYAATPWQPTLFQPYDNETNVALKPLFKWSGNGLSYKIQICNSQYFTQSSLVTQGLNLSNITTEWTPPSNLPANTKLWWRVIAYDSWQNDDNADKAISVGRAFTTKIVVIPTHHPHVESNSDGTECKVSSSYIWPVQQCDNGCWFACANIMLQCKAERNECSSIENFSSNFPEGSIRRNAWLATGCVNHRDWNCGLFGYCNRDSLPGIKHILQAVGGIPTQDEVYIPPKSSDFIPASCYTIVGYPTLSEIESWIQAKKVFSFSIRLGGRYGDGHIIVVYGYNHSNPGTPKILWMDSRESGRWQFKNDDYFDWTRGNTTTISNGLIPTIPLAGGILDIHDQVTISQSTTELIYPGGQYAYYSAGFRDANGNGTTSNDFQWQLVFYHESGEYILAQTTTSSLNVSSWHYTVEPLPEWYNWLRESNGLVKGQVRVSCIDSDGDGHSDSKDITYLTPPPPSTGPVLTAPLNNTTELRQPVTFNWNAVPHIQDYRIEISENEYVFNNPVAFSVHGTSSPVSGLGNGKQYFWRVGAINEWGITWSSTRTFTTDLALHPSKPVLLSPLNSTGIPRNPTFTWQATTETDFYKLVVVDNFTTVSYEKDSITATTWTIPMGSYLKRGTLYNWGVIAKNYVGSDTSSAGFFLTEATVPTLISPVSNQTIPSLSFLLDWQWLGSEVREHRIQVARDPNFTNMFKDTTLLGSPPDFTINGLSYSTRYYWRMNATYEDAESEWSTVESFTTRQSQQVPVTSFAGIILLTVVSGLAGVFMLAGRRTVA